MTDNRIIINDDHYVYSVPREEFAREILDAMRISEDGWYLADIADGYRDISFSDCFDILDPGSSDAEIDAAADIDPDMWLDSGSWEFSSRAREILADEIARRAMIGYTHE